MADNDPIQFPAPTMLEPAKTPVYDPASSPVTLGQTSYLLREVPIARLKRFRVIWLDFFGRLQETVLKGNLTDQNTAAAFLSLIEDKPGELLEIILPGFDRAVCDDEDDGPTIPQILHVFDQALSINGLDFLRKAAPFLGSLLRVGFFRSLAENAEETEASAKTS